VSPRKSVPPSVPKRRYSPPTLTKLTPEEALAALKERSIPGDEQAKKLRDAITSGLKNHDKQTK
jgi:hypothetical protein